MAMGAKIEKNPTFSKLMNFGPLMVTLLESLRQGYMIPKFCGPNFENGGDMAMGAKIGKPPLS